MITSTMHRKTTALPHMWVATDSATFGPAPDLAAGALTS